MQPVEKNSGLSVAKRPLTESQALPNHKPYPINHLPFPWKSAFLIPPTTALCGQTDALSLKGPTGTLLGDCILNTITQGSVFDQKPHQKTAVSCSSSLPEQSVNTGPGERGRGLRCARPRASDVTKLRPGARRLLGCWRRSRQRLYEVGCSWLSHGGGGARCGLGCTDFPRDVGGGGCRVRAGASCLPGGVSGHPGRPPACDGPKVATSCEPAPGPSAGGERPQGRLCFWRVEKWLQLPQRSAVRKSVVSRIAVQSGGSLAGWPCPASHAR